MLCRQGGFSDFQTGLPNNIARKKERGRKAERFARGVQTQEERDFCALQKKG